MLNKLVIPVDRFEKIANFLGMGVHTEIETDVADQSAD